MIVHTHIYIYIHMIYVCVCVFCFKLHTHTHIYHLSTHGWIKSCQSARISFARAQIFRRCLTYLAHFWHMHMVDYVCNRGTCHELNLRSLAKAGGTVGSFLNALQDPEALVYDDASGDVRWEALCSMFWEVQILISYWWLMIILNDYWWLLMIDDYWWWL